MVRRDGGDWRSVYFPDCHETVIVVSNDTARLVGHDGQCFCTSASDLPAHRRTHRVLPDRSKRCRHDSGPPRRGRAATQSSRATNSPAVGRYGQRGAGCVARRSAQAVHPYPALRWPEDRTSDMRGLLQLWIETPGYHPHRDARPLGWSALAAPIELKLLVSTGLHIL